MEAYTAAPCSLSPSVSIDFLEIDIYSYYVVYTVFFLIYLVFHNCYCYLVPEYFYNFPTPPLLKDNFSFLTHIASPTFFSVSWHIKALNKSHLRPHGFKVAVSCFSLIF